MWKDWVTHFVQVPEMLSLALSKYGMYLVRGRDRILGPVVTRTPVSTNPPNILSLYLFLDPRQKPKKAKDRYCLEIGTTTNLWCLCLGYAAISVSRHQPFGEMILSCSPKRVKTAPRVPQAQASGLPFSTKSSPWGRDEKPGEASQPTYPTLFRFSFSYSTNEGTYKIYARACVVLAEGRTARRAELTPRTAESPILDALTSR